MNATAEIDILLIIHDVRLALRESQISEGLVTIFVPDGRGSILLAPEGFEKDRDFRRWLAAWMQLKGEPPRQHYFSYLFGSSMTLPIEKGALLIDPNATLYLIDFTNEEKRRNFRVTIMKAAAEEKKGRGR